MTENQAMTRIASYCSKTERCTSEVRKKLLAWELENEIVEKIIATLTKEKFLDDERYCRSFVRDKQRFNKWGKNKIIFELRKKQIPELLINPILAEEIEESDFEDSLLKILVTKNRSVKADSDYERYAKLFRFASGRGFTPDQIKKCLNKLLKEVNEDDIF